MKYLILPLTACFTLIVQGTIGSSVQAGTPSEMSGICEFHEGGKLKLKQSCAIVSSTETQLVTLFWEDNAKTYIKTSSPSVDNAAAEKSQDGDRTCYQINENSNRVCYKISRKEPVRLDYGCGVDCGRVHDLLITDIRRASHKLNGKTLNTAVFFSRVNGVGKFSNLSSQDIVYVYASCSTKELGFSTEYKKAPKSFQQLSGDQMDYTTALSGRGYRFDALCK
jgi:hypothetical protein